MPDEVMTVSPTAPTPGVDSATRTESAGLQLGHRLGSAALILLIGGAAAFFAQKPNALLLLFAFGCADAGLLGAFVSLVLGRRAARRTREAMGTVLFCAVILLAAVVFLVLSHLRERNG